MDDTNIGAPHLGHRRCILGGNVAGSKLCGCGMVRPPSLIQAGARPFSQPPTPVGSALPGDVLPYEAETRLSVFGLMELLLFSANRVADKFCGAANVH